MSVSVSPLTSVHPAKNPDGKPCTIEEVWKLSRVGKPVPSPSGDFLVVPVTKYDIEKNLGATRLWKIPTQSGSPTPLTSADHNAGDPSFSPDGKKLAFLRKLDPKDKPQLYVMPMNGGEPEKMSDLPLGAMDPRWLPDGKRIVFISPLIQGTNSLEETKTRLEEREKDPVKARVTESRVYRFWDHWLTDEEFPHIFIMNLETGETKDITPGMNRWFDFMDTSGLYDISPDGKEIVFYAENSEPPHKLIRFAIFTVPVEGGEVRCLTPDNPADDFKPRYSPDGRYMIYGHQKDPFFYADRVRLIKRDLASGEETELLPEWDRSPSRWVFTKSGDLVIEAEDTARHNVYLLERGSNQPKALVKEGSATGITVSGEGYVYFSHETLNSPAEIASTPLSGGGLEYLTRFNAQFQDEIALGEVQEIEFAGAEGRMIQAFVVLPPGFDASKKWPLVHLIHGGPHGISGDGFHFRWNPHLLTAPGYVVVTVNFHGSTSWGQEFASCIQGEHGKKPFEDIMKGTDAVLATGFIDESRMAATGASYGGYLVAWIAGHTDRFRCIVNHAGVYNTLSQYASDITQGRHQSYGGEPWDKMEVIDDWNPSRYTDGFVTPMLVSHGERDYRVPVTQGLEIYGVLKAKGIDARLIYFPDENHWILKPKNSIFWYGEVLDWLKKYLT